METRDKYIVEGTNNLIEDFVFGKVLEKKKKYDIP
tara:strand:- start:566 stop:670 length:105 start_codon:yes stop_codon:yes gene_type:complete